MSTQATKAKLSMFDRDVFGGHGVQFFNYTGPSSYANTFGDEVDALGISGAQTSMRGIVSIITGITVSGLYTLEAQPVSAALLGAPGVSKWFIRWIVISTGLEVADTTNLSAEKAIIGVIGG